MCVSGDGEKRDEELFKEEYIKLKGKTDDHKYTHIPKFYTKVMCIRVQFYGMQNSYYLLTVTRWLLSL